MVALLRGLPKIYEEEGYNKSEIPTLILKNNLYGCDIDKRAMVLANFALTMKARLYHKRFFRKIVKPNIIELEEYGDERFIGIKNFGSLVRVKDNETFDDGIFSQTSKEYNLQLQMLTDKFDCIITNPPYINGSYMNPELKEFVTSDYPKTKSDLFACFMERIPEMTKQDGYIGFVTPFVWMFVKSYEWLREYILEQTTITNLVQLEYNAFGPAVVPVCSFTLKKSISNEKGNYIKLSDFKGIENQPIKTLQAITDNVDYSYNIQQNNFSKIPGTPIAYWVNTNLSNNFSKTKVSDIAEARLGMATADNDIFLRFWQEVEITKIGFLFLTREEAKESHFKWFPYQKGGKSRKWYGNYEYVVNWENDGYEIQNFRHLKTGKIRSHNYNLDFIFRKGITWNALSSGNTSMRISENSLFDNAGSSLFLHNQENLIYCLSIFNSKITPIAVKAVSSTMNFQPGDISKIPIVFPSSNEIQQNIELLSQQSINISKAEWDSRETSWVFTKNELIKHKSESKIETAYTSFCNYWQEQHNTLHQNEEELNRLFIDIYDLQDELTPEVELKDITILKNETKIIDDELVFQEDEIMKQFISYGVGVMFGRYSLDSDGLLIANMGQEVPADTTFEIDDDNVIPVLEDDYFKDDIASRFVQFVKTTFGEEHLSENIQFIEESLGTTLRKYFVKGFYEDHIKRYKKRPIYWMVASPKKGFMALMYMHRYQPDVFARVQNSYLREYITKLEATLNAQTQITNDESNSTKVRKDAQKQIDSIHKKMDEIIKFDRDHLTAFAQGKIEIDLDDGVKVNYCKFEDILYPISGLCKK